MDPTDTPRETVSGRPSSAGDTVPEGRGAEHQPSMGTSNLNLFPDALPPERPTLVPPAEPANSQPEISRADLWLQRLFLIIYVVFCVEIGMLLAVLPWTRVWTENSILVGYPVFKAFLQQNFVRGVVTGLGLLDIWLGVWEAVHYREGKVA